MTEGSRAMDDGDQVMSEMHIGCPPHHTSCLSHFHIRSDAVSADISSIIPEASSCSASDGFTPTQNDGISTENHIFVDEYGDLIMPRRAKPLHHVQTDEKVISIRHRLKTSIPYVGLQVWRGSLLLSDFLLHKMKTSTELDNVIGLELGTGTGLVGIVLAAKAQLLFLTDFSIDILDNCYRNVLLNSPRFNGRLDIIRIRQLDWQEPWPPDITKNSSDESYSWHASDLEMLGTTSIIFAADVIYDDSITDAFFTIVEKLMPSGSKKILWLALEKRYNFSMSDLDVVAHGYNHFRSYIDDETPGKGDFSDKPTYVERQEHGYKMFAGKQLRLAEIPQYIHEYERTTDLELWEIWRK